MEIRMKWMLVLVLTALFLECEGSETSEMKRIYGRNLFFAGRDVNISSLYRTCETDRVKIKTKMDYFESYVKERGVKSDYLLPPSLVPIHYDISIVPHLETDPARQFEFDGWVVTHFLALNRISTIVMHAGNLTVHDIELYQVLDNSRIDISNWTMIEDDRQLLIVELAKSLETDSDYVLQVAYTGRMRDIIHNCRRGGVQYSTHVENNTMKYVVATRARPIYSREIVPWFDQINYKARITLHMAREPGRTITANMPVETQGTPVPGHQDWVWVHFSETPPLCTYHFFFAIHQLESVKSDVDPRVTIFAQANSMDRAKQLIKSVINTVHSIENYTGVPFPLPKLDIMPWVTFKEPDTPGVIMPSEIFFDDLKIGSDLVSINIIGELPNQWIGGLVTPLWWNDAWIKQGLANYLPSQILKEIYPEWQNVNRVKNLVEIEGVSKKFSNHSLYTNVFSPAEILETDNFVSHHKAAVVIELMAQLMGDEQFRLGIRNLLHTMMFDSVDQNGLFRIFAQHAPALPSNVSLAQVMETYTKQNGFPLVTVTRDYDARTATIKQEPSHVNGTGKWIIPVTLTNGGAFNFSERRVNAWLLNDDVPIVLRAPDVPEHAQFLMLINGVQGSYKVNYDERNWNLIIEYLNQLEDINVMPIEHRVKIMMDAFSLALHGRMKYSMALGTLATLRRETDVAPWAIASKYVDYILVRVQQTASGKNLFKKFMQNKICPFYTYLGGFEEIQNLSFLHLTIREHLVTWACEYGCLTCINDGAALLRQWQAAPNPDRNNPIPSKLRNAAYCAAQTYGGQEIYEFLMARFPSSNPGDRSGILRGIACSLDTSIHQQLMRSIQPNTNYTPEALDSPDLLGVAVALKRNPKALDLLLDFIITNWEDLVSIRDTLYMMHILSPHFNTQEHYSKIHGWIEEHKFRLNNEYSLLRMCDQILQNLHSNLAWNAAHLDDVMQFLRNQVYADN